MTSNKRNVARCAWAVAIFFCNSIAVQANNLDTSAALQERLAHGEVVVGLRDEDKTKFVTGSVLINEPPARVWPILSNPYEFKGKISPRMKTVEMVVDKPDESIMKCTLDMSFLFPTINYVVESKYENAEKIVFKRIGGTLRDFRGAWEMVPIDNGTKTELTYSMYVDTGFPVPQWMVREGMKNELPRTLTLLRNRVMAICNDQQQPEKHSIMAANMVHHELPSAP